MQILDILIEAEDADLNVEAWGATGLSTDDIYAWRIDAECPDPKIVLQFISEGLDADDVALVTKLPYEGTLASKVCSGAISFAGAVKIARSRR